MEKLRSDVKTYPIGTMFGHLKIIGTPIRVISGKGKKIKQHCLCTLCGKECFISGSHIRDGRSKSCGCSHKRHMSSKKRIYKIYMGIRNRCNNKNEPSFVNYGGRGIRCERASFDEFYKDMGKSYEKHVLEYGEKETTIDRIDGDKNYCKENCRWATNKEQSQNRKCVTKPIYKGKQYNSIAELCVDLGINRKVVYDRMEHGYGLVEAIETPVVTPIKGITINGIRYKTKKEAAEKLGIPVKRIFYGLQKGYTPEQCLYKKNNNGLPVGQNRNNKQEN